MRHRIFSFMRLLVVAFALIAAPAAGLAADSTIDGAANSQPGVMTGNGHYRGDGHDHTSLGNGHYRGDGHDHTSLGHGHYRGDGHAH